MQQNLDDMIYNGSLGVYSNDKFIKGSQFEYPKDPIIYETGVYVRTASVFISASSLINNSLTKVVMNAGFTKNGGLNKTINHTWSLIK